MGWALRMLNFQLFPLDGCGRLGGDVVDDTVDVADLVDDARGRAVEDVVR